MIYEVINVNTGKGVSSAVLPEDTCNPVTWGAYSFEAVPNRFTSGPLKGKDFLQSVFVMGLSLGIYFAICYVITIV